MAADHTSGNGGLLSVDLPMESSSVENRYPSRSGSPESMASSELGNIDLSDEEEMGLYEDLEQTIAFDLETLTDSGSTVNQLELEHQKAWREYVRVKDEGLKHLQVLKKKLQPAIDKTEPFVVVWRRARDLQEQAHAAALKFERAHSEYESAKETLKIAEDGIANLEHERIKSSDGSIARATSPGIQIDEAWQETLANATERVKKTSQTRLECSIEHHRLTVEFQKCQADFKSMEQRLKRTIKKSRPYYEARHKCNQRLIEIKGRIQELDHKLSQHKSVYKSTMRHLENLSYLLHDHKGRQRSQSALMGATSEPNLAMPRPQTPDCPLPVSRMAMTPDVRKKSNLVTNIGFSFKGSAGVLPTVQPSKATANVVDTCSSPELKERTVRSVVSSCLSKALQRMENGDNTEVDVNVMKEQSGNDNTDSNHDNDIHDDNSNHGNDNSNDVTIVEPVKTIPSTTSTDNIEEKTSGIQPAVRVGHTDNLSNTVHHTELDHSTNNDTTHTDKNGSVTTPTQMITSNNSGSPEVSHSDTSSPGVSRGNTSSPAVNHDNTGTTCDNTSSPRTTHTSTSSPAVSRNNTSSPGVSRNNTSSPGLSHGNISSTRVSRNSTSSPAVSHSNTSSPGVSHGNISSPGVSRNNTSSPAAPKNNTSSPAVSRSNTSSPGVSHGNPSLPGMSQNNTSSPGVSHSNTSSPGVSHGNTISPRVSRNSTSSPGLTIKYNITY